MSSLSDTLLTYLLTYGAPLFGLILLVGAVGVPIPLSLMVIAAGAFTRQGQLELVQVAVLGLVGSVIGDNLSYSAGRFAGGQVHKRFGATALWKTAEVEFNHRGGIAIFLTRFLFTAIALPVNLLAGTGQYPYWRFLAYDVAGEAVWIVLYGGLGYLFGSEWEVVSEFISNFGGLLMGLLVLGAGIWMAVKQLRK